jgi:hypothetical protein
MVMESKSVRLMSQSQILQGWGDMGDSIDRRGWMLLNRSWML